jgi:predicted NAD/FAD-dependent oxidoreductase
VTDRFDDRLVEVQGPVWTFDADGHVTKGPDADERRWTYEDGITRLAKHLFGATAADVLLQTRIADVYHDGHWRLADTEGTEYGPFDALLLNPPAPQTAPLLNETGVQAADRLGEAADEVRYRTGWTAVLGYDFDLDAPYYALANADEEHEVGWIGREEQKPGHVPDGASVLVVQANPQWAAERYDTPPQENVHTLARHAADIVGDRRLRDPDWTDHQGWKYALAAEGVEDEAVRDAAAEGIYAAGDWVAGEGRVDAALQNGLETGEALADSVRESGASRGPSR